MSGRLTPLQIAPVTLTGRFVRLEPLTRGHVDALDRIAYAPSIWTWMPRTLTDRASLEAWVDEAVAAEQAGTTLALRYQRNGQYLCSFVSRDSLFIDIMMNVGIIFYAAVERGDG